MMTPKWNIAARITNLTNRDYADRADFSNFSGERYFPGEPRSLYLQMILLQKVQCSLK